MASVVSAGTTERMVARIRFKVLRAGSGTFARYSSTLAGAAFPVEAAPPLPGLALFIRSLPRISFRRDKALILLLHRSRPVHAECSMALASNIKLQGACGDCGNGRRRGNYCLPPALGTSPACPPLTRVRHEKS